MSCGFVSARRANECDAVETFGPFAPDLAVKVVSPNDSYDAVWAKVIEYADAGTKIVWIVHPTSETAAVCRSKDNIVVLDTDSEISGYDVILGFACTVKTFFS